MEKVFEADIECKSCKGTGVYVGMGERDGAAVVCSTCKGTGKQHYVVKYTLFTKRKIRDDVKRVYKRGYGYCLAPKLIDFKRIGPVDMTKEGVSYEEFLNGEMPEHIKALACPMLADQGMVHGTELYEKKCHIFIGAGDSIVQCPCYGQRAECWEMFDKEKGNADR